VLKKKRVNISPPSGRHTYFYNPRAPLRGLPLHRILPRPPAHRSAPAHLIFGPLRSDFRSTQWRWEGWHEESVFRGRNEESQYRDPVATQRYFFEPHDLIAPFRPILELSCMYVYSNVRVRIELLGVQFSLFWVSNGGVRDGDASVDCGWTRKS